MRSERNELVDVVLDGIFDVVSQGSLFTSSGGLEFLLELFNVDGIVGSYGKGGVRR
jgi:hypothetical protein